MSILRKGEGAMISNQILQSNIEGLKEITRIDLCVCDVEGKVLASTFEHAEEYESSILAFVDLKYLMNISLSTSCLQKAAAMTCIW